MMPVADYREHSQALAKIIRLRRNRALDRQDFFSLLLRLLLQQALLELLWFDVNKFYPRRPIKHPVGDSLGYGSAQNRQNRILEAFNVLHIQRRIDVDARFQQFFYILITFPVAGFAQVGVGKIVNHNQLRQPFDAGVQIQFGFYAPFLGDGFAAHRLQPLRELADRRPPIAGKQADHHIQPFLFGCSGGLQHGVAFPGAGEITGKNGELARCFGCKRIG